MAILLVLLRKEIKGHWRSYRLLGIVAVFFFFGAMTPLLLHYLPVLLPSQDLSVVLPKFTAPDVLTEYLDSVGQVGLIVAILMAMGAVSGEREKGTAAMLLCKPVNRGMFVLSKLLALGKIFFLGVVVGGLACYFYTLVLFGSVDFASFALANLVAVLYLLLCLSVTLAYSTMLKSQLAAGALSLVSLIGLAAFSAIPFIKDYSPGALISWSKSIAVGGSPSGEGWGALAVGLAVVALSLAMSWRSFNKAEI